MKLNDIARSYKILAQEVDIIDGFTFVWFTDGIDWKDAIDNLRRHSRLWIQFIVLMIWRMGLRKSVCVIL